MKRADRLKRIKQGSGFSDLLIGQFLIAILIYVAVAFYETSPQTTLVLVLLLLVGVLYYSWKGLRQLWYKGRKKSE